MTEGAKARVEAYLKKHGVSQELRVGRILKQAGILFPQHDVHYLDATSGTLKARRIDIVAGVSVTDSSNKFHASWSLAIECKYNKEPWVAFKGNSSGIFRDILAVPGLGRDELFSARAPSRPLPSFYDSREPHEGLIACIGEPSAGGDKPDKPDAAHNAIMQATSAAIGHASRLDRFLREGQGNTLALVEPTIVLSGELFSASLDANGDIQVEAIDVAHVMMAHPEAPPEVMTVTVIRETALAEYVGNLVATVPELLNRVLPQVGKLRGPQIRFL